MTPWENSINPWRTLSVGQGFGEIMAKPRPCGPGLFRLRHRAQHLLGGLPEVLNLLGISGCCYLDLQAWLADGKLQTLPAVEPIPKAPEVESGQHGGVGPGTS